MSSAYRADYASASPRTECCHCHLPIRSGELRLMVHSTFRHSGCVLAIEVLKMWQSCKSFEAIPGFRELEYADRTHLQALFRALLVSTPSQARSRMAAAAAAAAENATKAIMAANNAGGGAASQHLHSPRITVPSHMQDALQPSSSSNSPPFASANLYREPSDAQMMSLESSSSTSPPHNGNGNGGSDTLSLRSTSSSPPAPHVPAAAAGSATAAAAASSSSLPPSQPQLGSAHSILAGHLSALSLPNHNGNCGGGLSLSRSLPVRDTSGSHSTQSSPGMHERHISFGGLGGSVHHQLPAATNATGFGSRSVSPFGLLSLQPSFHQQQQQHAAAAAAGGGLTPSSPHSSHTSPVPFSHLQLATGAAPPTSAVALFGSHGRGVSPVPFTSASLSAPPASIATIASGAVGVMRPTMLRTKRKLDAAIPEEEHHLLHHSHLPATAAAAASAAGAGAVSAPQQPDNMMDGPAHMDDDHHSANAKRRRMVQHQPQLHAQHQQPQHAHQMHQPHLQQHPQQQPPPPQAQRPFGSFVVS
jgi:hypothetical protein